MTRPATVATVATAPTAAAAASAAAKKAKPPPRPPSRRVIERLKAAAAKKVVDDELGPKWSRTTMVPRILNKILPTLTTKTEKKKSRHRMVPTKNTNRLARRPPSARQPRRAKKDGRIWLAGGGHRHPTQGSQAAKGYSF